jgi:hypothetical protein
MEYVREELLLVRFSFDTFLVVLLVSFIANEIEIYESK